VFTVSGGKIVRHAVYWDNVAFLAQLGVAGQPEQGSQASCQERCANSDRSVAIAQDGRQINGRPALSEEF
jgi:hypothetical protein